MPADPARVKSVFLAAADLPDPAARAALVAEQCGDDAELRQRVEALLRVHDAPPDATADHSGADTPGSPDVTATFGDPAATTDRPGREEHVGAVIAGRYKLVEEIGEGGMGQVFMAQQTEPVRRAVAVKVIKAGMDSKAVLARFEAERQALALMDHPNIARVLDAGTTESGRPFFVMELVKGVPITQFCDARKLTPRERLELFVPVCQAIQHAHQKGVIHRDLKPSNVLVALYDDRPVPKVIDFGVAKAAGSALTDKTLMTGFGAVVGTPEYMSPEQASLNNLDIDTRSDVYSLGVLLYELLTGTTPVDRKSLGKAALLEVLRIVREVEAPKPSAKLSTIDTLPSVAANRGTEPAKLSRLMKGELDWVVLKALDKDRTRRYETANALSRDIQRYLADEVVEARPPSTGYRLRKFIRRHKGQVLAASLVLFALLAGIAGTTFGLIRADSRRIDAENARADETAQRQRAEDNERQAKVAEAEVKAVLTFFEERVLAAGGPESKATGGLGKDVTLRQALDVATAEVATAFQDKPLVEASIRNVLGVTYYNLGDFLSATRQLEQALSLRQAKLGPEHPNTLTSMFHLGEVYLNSGKRDRARPLAEEVFRRQRATLGPAHFDTLRSLWLLAMLSTPEEALPLFEESYKLRKATLGPEDPATLRAMKRLAQEYRRAGRGELALPLSEEAVRLMQATLGRKDSQTQVAMVDLAEAYLAAGKLDRALPLAEEALTLLEPTLGPEHPNTRTGMNLLVRVYDATRNHAGAIRVGHELLARQRRNLPADHPNIANTLAILGQNLLHTQKPAEAEPLLRECLAIRQKKEPEAWSAFNTQSLLGGALAGQEKYAEAEPLLVKGYEGMKAREKTIPPQAATRIPESIDRLIELYTATEKPDEAAKWRAERAKYPEVAPPPRAVKR